MQTYHIVMIIALAALCIDVASAVRVYGKAAKDNSTQVASHPYGSNVLKSLPDSAAVIIGPRPPVVLSGNPWVGRLLHVKQLAKGGFGVVYKAQDTFRGIDVAVKQMGTQLRKEFDHEVSMMQFIGRLNGANNIVRMYDAFAYGHGLCLTMEVLEGGDLFEMLYKVNGPLTLANSAALFKTMATAVKFLHDQNIVHHDLKPENFVFRYTTQLPADLVMIDLGLAKSYQPGIQVECTTGTAGYVPIFRLAGPCSLEHMKLGDSFALGRMLFDMSFGVFPDPKIPIAKKMIMIPDDDLRDLLLHITSNNPDDQLNIDQILAHPFLQNTQAQTLASMDPLRA